MGTTESKYQREYEKKRLKESGLEGTNGVRVSMRMRVRILRPNGPTTTSRWRESLMDRHKSWIGNRGEI